VLDVLGVESSLESESMPILRLPALQFRFGGAQIDDEPFQNDLVWWINLRWRP
jgi:hypothetical protein